MTSRVEQRSAEWETIVALNPDIAVSIEAGRKAERIKYESSPLGQAELALEAAQVKANEAMSLVELAAQRAAFQRKVAQCNPEVKEKFLGRGLIGAGPEAGSKEKITSMSTFPRFS